MPKPASCQSLVALAPALALTLTACEARTTASSDAQPVLTGDLQGMSPARRAPIEARARAGHVDAMIRLAQDAIDSNDRAAARAWFAQAAARGNCEAVRELTSPQLSPGAGHFRWARESRRLGCTVPRWQRTPRGIVLHGWPDSLAWRMRFACVDGRVEVSGPTDLIAPDGAVMAFRTSRGIETRRLHPIPFAIPALGYGAGTDDALVQAIGVRGEVILVKFHNWPPMAIDGRNAPPWFWPMLTSCGHEGDAAAG
jgi:hypothetical protein